MILVHLAYGFEEIEALTSVDIMRRVGMDAYLVSMEEDIYVEGAHGITVKADFMFDEIDYSKYKEDDISDDYDNEIIDQPPQNEIKTNFNYGFIV